MCWKNSGIAAWAMAALMPWVSSRATPTDCPDRPIRMVTSNMEVPLFLNGEGEQVRDADPGWLVLEVRRAMADIACPFELVRLPHRRVELEMTQGTADFAVGYGVLTERLQAGWAYPQQPDGEFDASRAIGHSRVAWVIRADRRAELEAGWRSGHWSARLGALTQSVAQRLVQRQGLAVSPVLAPQRVQALLALGRFDAIALPVETYGPLLRAADGQLAVLEPSLGTIDYFVPASRPMMNRHPTLVRRVWEQMCKAAQQRPLMPGCSHAARAAP